jgi:hypothetical protein
MCAAPNLIRLKIVDNFYPNLRNCCKKLEVFDWCAAHREMLFNTVLFLNLFGETKLTPSELRQNKVVKLMLPCFANLTTLCLRSFPCAIQLFSKLSPTDLPSLYRLDIEQFYPITVEPLELGLLQKIKIWNQVTQMTVDTTMCENDDEVLLGNFPKCFPSLKQLKVSLKVVDMFPEEFETCFNLLKQWDKVTDLTLHLGWHNTFSVALLGNLENNKFVFANKMSRVIDTIAKNGFKNVNILKLSARSGFFQLVDTQSDINYEGLLCSYPKIIFSKFEVKLIHLYMSFHM